MLPLSNIIDEFRAFLHDFFVKHALEDVNTCIYLAVKHGDSIIYRSDPLIHEHFFSLSYNIIVFGCMNCGL